MVVEHVPADVEGSMAMSECEKSMVLLSRFYSCCEVWICTGEFGMCIVTWCMIGRL